LEPKTKAKSVKGAPGCSMKEKNQSVLCAAKSGWEGGGEKSRKKKAQRLKGQRAGFFCLGEKGRAMWSEIKRGPGSKGKRQKKRPGCELPKGEDVATPKEKQSYT